MLLKRGLSFNPSKKEPNININYNIDKTILDNSENSDMLSSAKD